MNGNAKLFAQSSHQARKVVKLFVMASQVALLACSVDSQVEDLSPHSSAELIAEFPSVQPGEPFTVGLRISLDPGWHSYWLNPGDAGQPATIIWDMPAGYRAGEIQWPLPEMVEESSLVSYGYEEEVLLLTEIVPPQSLVTGQRETFFIEAHWLVCNNICLPASASLELEVQISDRASAPNRRWRELFSETRRKMPVVAEGWAMTATRIEVGFTLDLVPAQVPHSSISGAFFFASERGVLEHGAPQSISGEESRVRLTLMRSRYARGEPDRLKGVLVMSDEVDIGTGKARAVSVDVEISGEPNEN